MPTPKVAATLPFTAAVAPGRSSGRPHRPRDAGAPATLSFAAAYAERHAREVVGDAYGELLDEATDVARRLGYEVRRRLLGGAGGGCRLVDGRVRVTLDAESGAGMRLSVLADALRGDPRLARAPMSTELAEYLAPRRAA